MAASGTSLTYPKGEFIQPNISTYKTRVLNPRKVKKLSRAKTTEKTALFDNNDCGCQPNANSYLQDAILGAEIFGSIY